jgi:hypothetical protein
MSAYAFLLTMTLTVVTFAEPKLTQTPLFLANFWRSKPLKEHSWVHINPLDLGPVHGPFLAALQELDETARGVPLTFHIPILQTAGSLWD